MAIQQVSQWGLIRYLIVFLPFFFRPSFAIENAPDILLYKGGETSIATHPSDPNTVLVAFTDSVTSGTDINVRWHYTTNGFSTSSTSGIFAGFGDPVVAFDFDGVRFFNGTDVSDNLQIKFKRGTNWTTTTVENSAGSHKSHCAIDLNSNSPYKNHVYTAWSDDVSFDSHIQASRSTNGGSSFSNNTEISEGNGHASNLAIGPNGEIYAVWSAAGFTKSLNGGETWQQPRSIPIAGYTITSLKDGIAVNSAPSMAIDRSNDSLRGRIYIVYAARPSVDSAPDIYMIYSSDTGHTWSSRIKVNQDGSGKDQWFPWITVDPATGYLYVVYYDSRRFSGNDSAEVYISWSQNGGNTFEDVLVSDTPFTAAPRGRLDYISIAALYGVVWPCWSDDRPSPHPDTHKVYTSKMIFDLNAPLVTVTSPNGGEAWGVNCSYTISWNATDETKIKNVEIKLDRTNDGVFEQQIVSLTGNPGSYVWTVTGATSNNAKIKVIAYDWAGNSGSDVSDNTFAILSNCVVDPKVIGFFDLNKDGVVSLADLILAINSAHLSPVDGSSTNSNRDYINRILSLLF